jgi:flagellar biosynthetic protein FliP
MRNHLSFLRHYLEMVAAMFVGMLVLGPVWTALFPGLSASPAAAAMVMATDMALGMAAWMGVRGHGRKAVVEMCAAMYAPFVVLLVPYALGVIDGGALMIGGHVLMFPAMALAMLRHRHEYAG